jgi:hypothetical protein
LLLRDGGTWHHLLGLGIRHLSSPCSAGLAFDFIPRGRVEPACKKDHTAVDKEQTDSTRDRKIQQKPRAAHRCVQPAFHGSSFIA